MWPENEYVTFAEASEILGVHVSAIAKMLRRGDLRSRRQRRSLRRADVLKLRDSRAESARRRAEPAARKTRLDPEPPDSDQDWVRADAVSRHLNVGIAAVHQRSRRGRLPFALGSDGKTRFYLLAQVDMTIRAQAATRERKVAYRHP